MAGMPQRRRDDQFSPRVKILSAHELYREGLGSVLAGEGLVVELTTADPAAIGESDESRSVLLIDVEADIDVDLIARLRAALAHTPIVVLADQYHPESLRVAFDAGVDGYLVKTLRCEALALSLRLIATGEKIPSASVVEKLSEFRDATPSARDLTEVDAGLTFREVEIARHLTLGTSNKAMSRQMEISDATVKVHVKALLRKLGLANRTQVALWAARRGFSSSMTQH